MADVFLERLGLTWGLRYVDVGCGTGALTSRIVATCTPASVIGIDPSEGFVARVVESVVSDVARFQTGSVEAIEVSTPFADVDEFWRPFTIGAGPAPGYLASLSPDHQERLCASPAEGLDGRTMELTACAWAVTSINS